MPIKIRNKNKDNKVNNRFTLIDRLAGKITYETLDLDSNFSTHEATAFAQKGYIRVYNVVSYPAKVPYNEEKGFLSAILDSIKNTKLFKKDVDLFYESFNKPCIIRFDSKLKKKYDGMLKMKQNLENQISADPDKKLTTRDRELKQISNDVLQFRLAELNKKILSYDIIRNNQNRGKYQIESVQFIRVVSTKKGLLNQVETELMSRFKSVDIGLIRVKDLSDYFETYSPISGLFGLDNKSNDYSSTVFTTSGYSKIRNKPDRILENEFSNLKRLINMGTDIYSSEPVGLSFTSSGNAQNILIAGTSGSGKTYLFQNLMMSARLNNLRANIMDYKSGEYDIMADLIPNSIILDFGQNSTKFVNTLKFVPELFSRDQWKKSFVTNTELTVTSLRILAGIEGENVKAAENALLNMINSIYANYGVYYDDIDSYYHSKNIDYFKSLCDGVAKFHNDHQLWSYYGENVCRQLYSGLVAYFSTLSSKRHMFEEEIDLGEVLNKDCVIYSFGMNLETEWSTMMQYKIFNQDILSNAYIQYNNRNGITTINSIEEYQRAVRYPECRKIYNNKLSGGRSDNVINVVITNTLAPLLDKDLEISAIRENITTLLIGKLKDWNILSEFCQVFNISEDMDKIASLKDRKHVFYINYDTGVQKGSRLINVLHPAYVSKALETRTIDEEFDYEE